MILTFSENRNLENGREYSSIYGIIFSAASFLFYNIWVKVQLTNACTDEF